MSELVSLTVSAASLSTILVFLHFPMALNVRCRASIMSDLVHVRAGYFVVLCRCYQSHCCSLSVSSNLMHAGAI